MQILIVEDEAIVAMDVRERLKRLGYEVVGIVDTAENAVQFSETLRPDLVLMDIHLKGKMDGVAAADQIRTRFDLPVIFLTAYADDATLERAKVTQPYGYLLKPFKDQELRTIIEVALHRHRSAKASRERQQERAQSEKMGALRRLIGAVAHEINNPLQAVQGCLALSREVLESVAEATPGQAGEEWGKVAQYLRIAEAESERIAIIVRRVRDFFPPVYSDQQEIDVRLLLKVVLEGSREQLRAVNITVEEHWAATPLGVRGDPAQLERVFLSVVRNAVEAMPSGGILRLSATVDKIAGGGIGSETDSAHLTDVVRIDCEDFGAGMSSEVQARLFEPFFTTKKQGAGLGLFISYGILQAHNGQIQIESQEGAGTTVRILLPAMKGALPDIEFAPQVG